MQADLDATALFDKLFSNERVFQNFHLAFQNSGIRMGKMGEKTMASCLNLSLVLGHSGDLDEEKVDKYLKKKELWQKQTDVYSSRLGIRNEFKQRRDFNRVWAYMDHCLDINKLNEHDIAEDPFFSFCLWIQTHCTIPHAHKKQQILQPCRGIKIMRDFLNAPDAVSMGRELLELAALIRFCHLCRFWHVSTNLSAAKEASANLQKLRKDLGASLKEFEQDPKKLAKLQYDAFQYDHLMLGHDMKRCGDCFSSKTQCIFELCYAWNDNTVFDYCYDDNGYLQLKECMMKLLALDYIQLDYPISSPLTNRWIFLTAGRAVKEWGHRSKLTFEQSEVEKEGNVCEKWRHQIYSYAVISLLFDQFNGNKEGPLGKYFFRKNCEIGEVSRSSGSDSAAAKEFVYGCKSKDEPRDYVGHNIVALAICKRGSVLRVAYNHNVLFTSTVDHAEERLMDGLFKDPEAFVAKSHARIFQGKHCVDIEKHMQHISVYTSLEPCQQCSGKFHIAQVPEVIFCQRDWDIQLLQVRLYEQYRKCRSVPASNFDFPLYEELATGYYNFQDSREKRFFKLQDHEVPAKKTMPYFLCTDQANDIFERGAMVFSEVFKILFGSSNIDIQAIENSHRLFLSDDWKGAAAATEIREYRPSLDRKQKRVLHDELSASRTEWIHICHKRNCSVLFEFDRGCRITEHDIDRHFASLTDIDSIYLPREFDGSLKGTATLVCINRQSAQDLIDLFKEVQKDQSGKLVLKHNQHAEAGGQVPERTQIRCLDCGKELQCSFCAAAERDQQKGFEGQQKLSPQVQDQDRKSDKPVLKPNAKPLSPRKRNLLLHAAKWLYDIRVLEREEVIIYDKLLSPSTVARLEVMSKAAAEAKVATAKTAADSNEAFERGIFSSENLEAVPPDNSTATAETSPESPPGTASWNEVLRYNKKVLVLPFRNQAHACKMKKLLPNLATPNETSIWPFSYDSFSSSSQSEAFITQTWCKTSGIKESTLSIIARKDAAYVDVINFLAEILHDGQTQVKRICRYVKSPLKTCDSNAIEWLHIQKSGAVFKKWKLWSIQFRSEQVVVDERKLRRLFTQAASRVEDEEDKNIWRALFRQPFPQPVLNLVYLREDGSYSHIDHQRFFKCIGIVPQDPKAPACPPPNPQPPTPKGLFCLKLTTHLTTPQHNFDSKSFVDLSGTVYPCASSSETWFEYTIQHKRKIEMDLDFLVNLLLTDMLSSREMRSGLQQLFELVQGSHQDESKRDFWGKRFIVDGRDKPSDNNITFNELETVLTIWRRIIWKSEGQLVVAGKSEGQLAAAEIPEGELAAAGSVTRSLSAPSFPIQESSFPDRTPSAPCLSTSHRGWRPVICVYCGCHYTISVSIWEVMTSGSSVNGVFCCSGHTWDSPATNSFQIVIRQNVGKQKLESKAQDPALDKNLANLFCRICELEKLLMLQLNVGSLSKLYFRDEDGQIAHLSLRFQFRRDAHDGPVHIAFCIEGPVTLLCNATEDASFSNQKDYRHRGQESLPQTKQTKGVTRAEELKKRKKSKANIEFSVALTDYLQPFVGDLSSMPEFDVQEYQFPTQQVHICRVYGRLKHIKEINPKSIQTLNEGFKLPADFLRRLMEPEYYDTYASSARYPCIEFTLKIPLQDDSKKNTFHSYKAQASPYLFQELWLPEFRGLLDAQSRLETAQVFGRQFSKPILTKNPLESVSGLLLPNVVDGSDAWSIHVFDDENGCVYAELMCAQCFSEDPSNRVANKILKIVLKSRDYSRASKHLKEAHICLSSIFHLSLEDLDSAEWTEKSKWTDECMHKACSKICQAQKDQNFEGKGKNGFLTNYKKAFSELFELKSSESIIAPIGSSVLSISSKCESDWVAELRRSARDYDSIGSTVFSTQAQQTGFAIFDKCLLDLSLRFIRRKIPVNTSVRVCIALRYPQSQSGSCIPKFEDLLRQLYGDTIVFDSIADVSSLNIEQNTQQFIKQARENFASTYQEAIIAHCTSQVSDCSKTCLEMIRVVPGEPAMRNLEGLKFLECFKYFLDKHVGQVFAQIEFEHVKAVCDIGKELERECDFATALKYYYAGRAYYAKRAFEMSTSLSSSTTCKPMFHALHDALTKVAENDANWKIRNAGGLLQSQFGGITISPETCAEHVVRLVGQHLQLKGRTSSVQEVLSSASELYGVGIYEKVEEQLPSTAELPHILLQRQSGDGEALFSWSVNTKASVLEPRHKGLKEEFDHLFKKLLPYSNQKAYEKASESVNYQKVVLKRGTMSK